MFKDGTVAMIGLLVGEKRPVKARGQTISVRTSWSLPSGRFWPHAHKRYSYDNRSNDELLLTLCLIVIAVMDPGHAVILQRAFNHIWQAVRKLPTADTSL